MRLGGERETKCEGASPVPGPDATKLPLPRRNKRIKLTKEAGRLLLRVFYVVKDINNNKMRRNAGFYERAINSDP